MQRCFVSTWGLLTLNLNADGDAGDFLKRQTSSVCGCKIIFVYIPFFVCISFVCIHKVSCISLHSREVGSCNSLQFYCNYKTLFGVSQISCLPHWKGINRKIAPTIIIH